MEMISSALVTVTVILIIVIILIIIYKNSHSYKLLSQIPGPKTNFIFGNAHQFLIPEREFLQTAVKMMQDFTKIGIAKVWFGYKPYVILMKAETIQPLLSNKKEINKSTIYNFLSPSEKVKTGIATSRSEAWHKRRKLLNPIFHYRVLEAFLKVFNEKSQSFVKKLENQVGKYVNFNALAAICTLDVICATAMGYDIQADDEESSYLKATSLNTSALVKRIISPWYHPRLIWQNSPIGREYIKNVAYMDNLANKIILKKRQELLERNLHQQNIKSEQLPNEHFENHQLPTAVDILIECVDENGKSLTDLEIIEEVNTIIFAGNDSTATAIFWSLFFIGRNPEIQEKAHKEVDLIFGDSDRTVNNVDLTELKYLECIYKEALRLCPSFPLIGRKLQEDLQIGQYTIPGGTEVAISTYLAHRDPDYFPDPERFDPDRFLPENNNTRHPYAFIPFSAGSRNCIGQKYATMEMKVVLSYILRNFKVTTLYDGEVNMIVAMVLRPTPEETMLFFEKRRKHIEI